MQNNTNVLIAVTLSLRLGCPHSGWFAEENESYRLVRNPSDLFSKKDSRQVYDPWVTTHRAGMTKNVKTINAFILVTR